MRSFTSSLRSRRMDGLARLNMIMKIFETKKLNFSRNKFLPKNSSLPVLFSVLALLLTIMPCFSNFCCGYGLRSGGSFIGYLSITVYMKLFILCVTFLWCIKNRIDESDGIDDFSFLKQFSNLLRVRSNNFEIESSIQELKSKKVYFQLLLHSI